MPPSIRGEVLPDILPEQGCAFVLVGQSRIMVMPDDRAQAERRHGMWNRTKPLAMLAGTDTIALVDAGASDIDLVFEAWPLHWCPASATSQRDVAVACAVTARLCGLVLPEPILVAVSPDRLACFELVPPRVWWHGLWFVRPLQGSATSLEIEARLLFHGELVLTG